MAGNQTGNHELKMTALDTLCALVFQLGHDYAHFIPMINKVRNTALKILRSPFTDGAF